jgi:hypothetical protein
METKRTIYNESIQTHGYAGDVVTVGRSIDALKETMKKLLKAAQVMGLMQKTKYCIWK